MNRKIKIVILLMEKNITQRYLARKFRVHPSAICNLIAGKMKSDRLQRLVAKELNMDPKELWQEKEAA